MRLNTNFFIMLLIDALCIILAFIFAYLLRFDFVLSEAFIKQIFQILPYLILLKLSVFSIAGIYRGMYRYTSLSDILSIITAVTISTTIIITVILLLNRFEGVPRSVFILDGFFTFCFITGNRVIIRFSYANSKNAPFFLHQKTNKNAKALLLIGAGQAAEKIIREVSDNRGLPYRIVGLVDDDIQKTGKRIHGYPIYGTIDQLQSIADRTEAQELLITIASPTGSEIQRIVDKCRQTNLPYKIVPGFSELMANKSTIRSIREINFQDLLGRPTINLDQSKIGAYLTNQTVLITGAGGSIGSELCRQILKFQPKKLILLDTSEENLYNIEMEFTHDNHFTSYVAVLGKIQNRALLNSLFCKYTPSVVFHAAAYKHVPLVELNPWEAVFNNVFAVRNLIETSIFHKVNRFVLVSTDKAVRPTNVMGATKRLTEKIMLAYSKENWDESLCHKGKMEWVESCEDSRIKSLLTPENKTTFMAVRFGNVLGSSGSVIPLFRKQIQQGGPVTVTHPDINRFFMSLDEAAQLILQAGAMGDGGEIFVLKMGEPIKIDQLARDLISLMGYEPDKDIKIEYVGLRPGEKLYEELITDGEGIVPTSHHKIMVLRGASEKYAALEKNLSLLAERAKLHDARGIKEILQALIPEYVPDYKIASVVDKEQGNHHNRN